VRAALAGRQAPSYHQLSEALRIGRRSVECGDDATGAHDADPVGDGEHLLQLVGHQQDRASFSGEPAQHGKEPLALLRGQYRGRLIKDQDIGAAAQRSQDLEALAQPDRQGPGDRLGVERQVEVGGETREIFAHFSRATAQ
jgi:hypothetical protein